MQIKPLTLPSEVSGKSDAINGGASIEKVKAIQGLPSQSSQSDQAKRLTELQEALAQHDITLSYTKDDATDKMVIRLVDDRTGESIRQIPNEVSLKLAAHIQGRFLDQLV